jgi:hypothetical protein
MKIPGKCKTCKFSQKRIKPEEFDTSHLCKRFPQMVPKDADDWCGEFKRNVHKRP